MMICNNCHTVYDNVYQVLPNCTVSQQTANHRVCGQNFIEEIEKRDIQDIKYTYLERVRKYVAGLNDGTTIVAEEKADGKIVCSHSTPSSLQGRIIDTKLDKKYFEIIDTVYHDRVGREALTLRTGYYSGEKYVGNKNPENGVDNNNPTPEFFNNYSIG